MNLALLPQIAALLGNPGMLAQAGGGDLASLPNPASPMPQTDPSAAQPDISVASHSIPPSQRRSGLIGGGFGVGRTGGNILGILGDALLSASGRNPVYAGRLQQSREAEALQNYSTDPLTALQKLTMIDVSKVLPAFNQYYDNQRADKITDVNVRDKNADYEDSGRSAIGSMLYSANEKTFPAVLARARAFAARRGIDTSDLPQTWEEAKGWATGTVPVEKQEGIETNQAYKDALATYRQQNLQRMTNADRARADYYTKTIGVRRDQVNNSNPANRPATPSTVVGRLMDKQASGQPLTPQESAVLNYYKPPKAASGGGAFSYQYVPGKGLVRAPTPTKK